MYLKRLELSGFKSFAKKTTLLFNAPVTAVVGPNGSGKSNVAESFRWALGEQSLTTIRGKRGEDFIFNGSNESARMNHASVAIVFDNSKKQFPLDYEEIVVARHVYRDGTNEYFINQSKVRLKDVLELIASVGLGQSNHYIISQGEADRMLSANKTERLKMIEDALGLALFEYKKKEATKKLEKTEENLRQVESLRREISPHLKYLKKQVEQLEKAEAMKADLRGQYQTYFASEEQYLEKERSILGRSKQQKQAELARSEQEREELEALTMPEQGSRKQLVAQLEETGKTLGQVRHTKDEVARTLGRLEGMIEATKAGLDQSGEPLQIGRRCPSCGQVVTPQGDLQHVADERLKKERRLTELEVQQREAARLLAEANSQEATLEELLRGQRGNLDAEEGKTREADQRLFGVRARKQELVSALALLQIQEEKFAIEEADFKRECAEAAALLGREVLAYAKSEAEGALVPRPEQENRRRQIERLKIRIEEIGGGHSDVLKEFQELSERDQFLAKEVEDLIKGAESLRKLMSDLAEQLKVQFKEGLAKINTQFNNYFQVLFGGGSAALDLIQSKLAPMDGEASEDEGQPEEGLEINVTLPRKKIRGLQMLSGGERTLTSLALLFAVSQVNPPPFLVLDETDAALDESNSKKYGEMLEQLALKSQLIIITHNRETMSHAGVLYGITMGKDAVSRVLSIKFEDAEAIAAR